MRPEQPPFIDRGDSFHRLRVLRLAQKSPRKKWLCACLCGGRTVATKQDLLSGNTKSCGCLQREAVRTTGRARATHGHKRGGKESPEYRAWHSMRLRCYRKTHKAFKDYGGRGITVCAAWRKSFQAFLRDVGLRPRAGMSLGRIDNNAGYFPGNVEWQTHRQQCNNRRSSQTITAQGRTQTVAEWARELGVYRSTLRRRRELGWSDEAIVLTKVDHRIGNHR
jgi:hypothetical protein